LSELEEVMRMEGAPLKNRLSALIILVKEFLRRVTAPSARDKEALESLALKKAEFEKGLEEVHKEEAYIGKELQALRRKIENERDASHEAERELFAAMSKRNELEIKLAELRAKESTLAHEKEALRSELAEAGVLLGQDATLYDSWQVVGEKGEVTEAEILEEERSLQAERKRRLERLKIKLEATATSNAKEILKEHEETSERDRFLTRELGDLEVSVKKLHDLIEELTTTLEERFADGIKKINIEFERFFKLMFGGGSAMLSITKEMFGGGSAMLSITKEKKLRRAVGDEEDVEMFDEDGIEVEEGIEISISLPHKRIKGLHMLSGGERALTSIALIFAMSQVNPPPFLILDETDAALDEANSRRYGDMIESLSKRSQLILITHNRETMSRAGVLYGVTMGSDGASKLLSVKFDEALAVAK
jgi:chromosome segregation protein